MKRIGITLAIFIMLYFGVEQVSFSQSVYSFTIDEAQQFAFEHNYNLLNSEKDVEIARNKVKEYLSFGFPQLDASIALNNYLSRPTFILPEGSFGPDSPEQKIQFGTKYNAYGQFVLNQIIFDGRYLLGIQACKKLLIKKQKDHQKNQLDIKEEVAKAYYTVLITEKNETILDTTLFAVNNMLDETREVYKSGFAEDTDVDQLELIVADLEATVIFSKNNTELAYSYLKFILGLQLNDSIVLKDDINDLLSEVNHTALITQAFNYNQNINYKIIKVQEELAVAKLKAEQTEYLPAISAFFSYQTQAQRNQFDLLNKKGQWFPTSILGFEMSIPLWSSGTRSAKVQQAKLNLDKVHISNDQLRKSLTIQANTAKSEFKNAYLYHLNKSKSLETAEKIYRKTAIKYREGISSSMDLLQAHNQFLTTESEYILSIMALLETKLTLEKLLTKF
jgi:outer membrane protein TolC